MCQGGKWNQFGEHVALSLGTVCVWHYRHMVIGTFVGYFGYLGMKWRWRKKGNRGKPMYSKGSGLSKET